MFLAFQTNTIKVVHVVKHLQIKLIVLPWKNLSNVVWPVEKIVYWFWPKKWNNFGKYLLRESQFLEKESTNTKQFRRCWQNSGKQRKVKDEARSWPKARAKTWLKGLSHRRKQGQLWLDLMRAWPLLQRYLVPVVPGRVCDNHLNIKPTCRFTGYFFQLKFNSCY